MIERLPIEDLDNGRYINDRDRLMTTIGPDNISARYYVDAELFMDVQKERDDYRRVLAVMNALRAQEPGSLPDVAIALLSTAGFDMGDARAMVSLLAEARTW